MAHARKSLEMLAIGAFSVWGTYRAIGWLQHSPTAGEFRERRDPSASSATLAIGFQR